MRHLIYCTRLFLCFVFLGGAVSGNDADAGRGADELPTAAMLYRAYVQANGGHANLLAMNTLVVDGVLTMGEQAPVGIKIYRKRPNRLRMRLEFEGFQVETIYDGKSGWRRVRSQQLEEAEIEQLEEAALAELEEGSSLQGPMFHLGTRLDDVLEISSGVVNGREAYRLQLREVEDFSYAAIWLDAEHYQELKLERRAGVDLGEGIESIIISDFDQINGVYFGRRVDYYTSDGDLVKALEVEEIRVNVGLFDAFFNEPTW